MSEKKNIDKLFKEQLRDFEVAPNDAVWERIEHELHKEERDNRKVIPFWWKLAGIAAILALLLTIGNSIFGNSVPTAVDNTVVDREEQPIDDDQNNTNTDTSDFNAPKNTEKTPLVEQNTSDKVDPTTNHASNNGGLTSNENHVKSDAIVTNQKNVANTSAKDSSLTNHTSQTTKAIANRDQLPFQKNHKESQRTTQDHAVVQNGDHSKSNTTNDHPKTNQNDALKNDKLLNELKQQKETKVTNSTKDQLPIETTIDSTETKEVLTTANAIEEAIAETEKKQDSSIESKLPLMRWAVAPNVAPVYFNSLGKGSPIDQQFVDNTKEGQVNMSYGIKGSYAINNKLKIRAGINKVDLGYSTNNILVFGGSSRSVAPTSDYHQVQLGHVKFTDSLSSTSSFVSANSISFTTGPEILFTKEQGSIDQQLGFIEVPVEIEYSLLDKKVGVHLIGGFSTLFLSNNEVYAVESNGRKTLIGEATNINDMSYSANFGIGFNYNFSKQFIFNLEPTFKYQINTFNDSFGQFQPFFIGVYTGLSFKF